MAMEVVFSKTLTKSDLKYKLGIPAKARSQIRPPGDGKFWDMHVCDLAGKDWIFRCYFLPSGRPFFTSGWHQFVRAKELKAGDTVILKKKNDEAGVVRYTIVESKREQSEEDVEEVENQSQASITTSKGDGISSGAATETNSSPHWTTSTSAPSELSQQIVEDEAQRTTDASSIEETKLRPQSIDSGGVSEPRMQRHVLVDDQSRSIDDSVFIDIPREDNKDDEQRDHFSLKVTVYRGFAILNFIVEIPSAVFDQLSSMEKPQYALVSLILSFTALLFGITELFYKGGVERVAWRWNEKIPWFYYPSPSHRPFGNVTDFIGLICAILQFIVATNTYARYLQHADNSIEISLWPLVFATCLLFCKFLNNPHKKTL